MELIIFSEEETQGTMEGVSQFIDKQLKIVKEKLPKKYAEAPFPPKITFLNKWCGKCEDIRQKFIPVSFFFSFWFSLFYFITQYINK